MKLMTTPDPEEFIKIVGQYENKYKGSDQIYLKVIEDFKKTGFCGLCDLNVDSILRLYLLKWGRMGRVLGYKGCKRIGGKLEEMENQFGELQKLTLIIVDIGQKSDEFEILYNELLNAKWKSDKGRLKRVGPTATSKVLHLVIPDLFMMWDSKIRKTYGFKDSGVEYVRFLVNMQNWIKKLGTIVKNLQAQYGKPLTKLIDEYNWKKCWG